MTVECISCMSWNFYPVKAQELKKGLACQFCQANLIPHKNSDREAYMRQAEADKTRFFSEEAQRKEKEAIERYDRGCAPF